jgi:hypothetical protein
MGLLAVIISYSLPLCSREIILFAYACLHDKNILLVVSIALILLRGLLLVWNTCVKAGVFHHSFHIIYLTHLCMKCIQLYINSVRTSQETHYVSATNTNRLMLFIVRIKRNTNTVWTNITLVITCVTTRCARRPHKSYRPFMNAQAALLHRCTGTRNLWGLTVTLGADARDKNALDVGLEYRPPNIRVSKENWL